MSQEPVLVVHGVANRSEQYFEEQVATLQKGLGQGFDLIPAWWGDLGAPSEYILRTTPAGAQAGVYETRAGGEAAEKQEVDVIYRAATRNRPSLHETRGDNGEASEFRNEIATTWSALRSTQPKWSDDELMAIGTGVAEGIMEDKPAGRFETRASGAVAMSTVKNVMKGITAAWTSFKGTALGGMQQDFRSRHLPQLTEFLGDIIVYQRHRTTVQAAVRSALTKYASAHKLSTTFGTAERPLSVIGHSLGGVIAFDMAVASEPPLHISKLVTMGSQPAFFHVVDPRDDQKPPRIAPYVGKGLIKLPSTISHWRNFWEPLDPFAFVANGIFDGDFDVPVSHLRESGLYTHSDYWKNESIHRQIKMFLE